MCFDSIHHRFHGFTQNKLKVISDYHLCSRGKKTRNL
jgi:hypothetical protein